MALEKHNIVCSIFLATLITFQLKYYASETTKRSRALKHKDTVKIVMGDQDVIDCVNMNKQLSSNHHNIDDNNKDLKSAFKGEIIQAWHKHEKCPGGTVPIRRRTSYIIRKHPSLLRRHFNSSLNESTIEKHEYVLIRSNDTRYYGATATLTVWKPKVDHNEFSLTQLWISSGNGTELNTIEVGWIRDSYKTTGYYDSDCPGFVQTDFSIKIGGPIFPISIAGGPIIAVTIMVFKDSSYGNWWLSYNGVIIGYFPNNLFTSLSNYAEKVDIGGEIVNLENNGHHTPTQMGSGLYPHQSGASFVTGIKLFDQDRNPINESILSLMVSTPQCYGVYVSNNKIFYGGPGYSEFCR
ncbi:uncharacterized protein LOC124943712 [Impatiens glandulifera]|uniref:uncharacterized protein LOC124943712 n=1 Tax=Impatiens glandulifera TaxID=253017 RepID=UPI001FB0AF77|nr:uncharacterized protein LOC124943712 [Impatiens glandulifera]